MRSDELLEVGIFPVPVSVPSPILTGMQPVLSSACTVAVDDTTTAVPVLVFIPLLVNCGTSLPPSLAVAYWAECSLGLPVGSAASLSHAGADRAQICSLKVGLFPCRVLFCVRCLDAELFVLVPCLWPAQISLRFLLAILGPAQLKLGGTGPLSCLLQAPDLSDFTLPRRSVRPRLRPAVLVERWLSRKPFLLWHSPRRSCA